MAAAAYMFDYQITDMKKKKKRLGCDMSNLRGMKGECQVTLELKTTLCL